MERRISPSRKSQTGKFVLLWRRQRAKLVLILPLVNENGNRRSRCLPASSPPVRIHGNLASPSLLLVRPESKGWEIFWHLRWFLQDTKPSALAFLLTLLSSRVLLKIKVSIGSRFDDFKGLKKFLVFHQKFFSTYCRNQLDNAFSFKWAWRDANNQIFWFVHQREKKYSNEMKLEFNLML